MRQINAKKIAVTMSDGTVFNGFTNVGNSRRISDFIKRNESTFIVLFDASMGENQEKEVYFINTNHVMWIKPDEKAANSRPEDLLSMSIENDLD